MSQVTVRVDGDKKLVAQFGRVAADARARVKRTVRMLGLLLTEHVQKTKLRGQRLNQRTGRLIMSVHEETEDSGPVITSTVGTNVKYARPHEFGFSGTVMMKAHMRQIKQAWGKPITPREVLVRAHPVKRDITEKRMFRDSLEEFRPTVSEKLTKLAQDIAKETGQ